MIDMKARGRNGNFDVAKIEVGLTAGGNTCWIEFFSKRVGNRAPIMLVADTPEMVEVLRDIIRDIEWKRMTKKGGNK